MKEKRNPFLSVVLVICILALLGFIAGLFPCTCAVAGSRAKEAACCSNLSQLGKAVRMYSMNQEERFPDSLQGLAPDIVPNPKIFACPAAHGIVGDITNVNSWTSYTYIGGLSETNSDDTVLAYCPPQHHEGLRGVILFVDGSINAYPSKEFWNIVKTGRKTPTTD